MDDDFIKNQLNKTMKDYKQVESLFEHNYNNNNNNNDNKKTSKRETHFHQQQQQQQHAKYQSMPSLDICDLSIQSACESVNTIDEVIEPYDPTEPIITSKGKETIKATYMGGNVESSHVTEIANTKQGKNRVSGIEKTKSETNTKKRRVSQAVNKTTSSEIGKTKKRKYNPDEDNKDNNTDRVDSIVQKQNNHFNKCDDTKNQLPRGKLHKTHSPKAVNISEKISTATAVAATIKNSKTPHRTSVKENKKQQQSMQSKKNVSKDFFDTAIYCTQKYSNLNNEVTSGYHDEFINYAWECYNKLYYDIFKEHLCHFDTITDLFYIRSNYFLHKHVALFEMTNDEFVTQTDNINIIETRRKLYDKNILLITVPTKNRFYSFFLNKIVISYMYNVNAYNKFGMRVYVSEDNIERPNVAYSIANVKQLLNVI